MILINENIAKWYAIRIVDILMDAKMVDSKSEARRIIEQEGIKIHADGQIMKIEHKEAAIFLCENEKVVLQKGKKTFLEIYI